MQSNELKQEGLIQQAIDAERQGDTARVTTLLEEALTLSATARLWTWLGQCYNDLEQFSMSLDAFREALAIDVEYAPAYSGLAQALENLGRYSEAETSLVRAIELKPTTSRYVLLGDVQRSMQRDTDAEKSFLQALHLEPENEEALFNLAVTIRHDRPAEAESLLRRAVAIDPHFAAARAELGYELGRYGAHEEAIKELRQSLELDPEQRWARVYLASVLWSQGRIPDAESELRLVSRAAALWAVPLWLLGLLYEETGRSFEAQEYFRRAANTDPSDANSAFQLGRYLIDFGLRVEGKRWLERALALDPNHQRARTAHSSLGW